METPAIQLGVELQSFEDEAKGHAQMVAEKPHSDRPRQNAWLLLAFAEAAAKYSYLAGNWSVCAQWCRITADEGIYFLFGDWREREVNKEGKIDPKCWFEEPKTREYWALYLEEALGWVAVGHCWDGVSQLLQFPRPEVGVDDDGPVPRAYLLGLARWWRDRQDIAGVEEAKRVRGAGSKYYQFLCDIAVEIPTKNQATLQKLFPKCVEHFIKRRDHEEHFPLAATFLWNVAKRDGLKVQVPEEIAKFLFEIPQEYWDEQGEPT